MKTNQVSILSYVIIVLMPLVFLLFSQEYSGPAYLADEIGYLSKAAFLGGHVVDGSSSYYGGYAFFLSPFFAFLNSSSAIWKGAMFLNALLWMGSFFLLNQLLTIWKPDISEFNRFCTLLFSALYPAWVTMAGYVFPTSPVVFLFLCCVISLAKWRQTDAVSLLPHSLCIGYLSWTHPTALGVALASMITVAVISRHNRSYRGLVMHVILVVLLILLYQIVLHPWMNKAMTPQGYPIRDHYHEIFLGYEKNHNFSLLSGIVVRLFGQISYITISSFGLIFFGLIVCFEKGKMFFISRNDKDCVFSGISLFLVLSVFFVVCTGAILFTGLASGRADHFIYGRYIDGFVLPLLAIGFLALCQWQRKIRMVSAIIAILLVAGTGCFIAILHIAPQDNNIINTPAFWPQYLVNSIRFSQWLLLGSVGVLIVGILGEYAALALMIGSFILCSVAQVKWHKNILSGHSKPTSIVDFIRTNFPSGSCVGFDDRLPPELADSQKERFGLYSFYFYDYGYRRMVLDEWRAHCNGPLLTYNPQQFIGSSTEHVIGRENVSGLFLVVKDRKDFWKEIPEDIRSRGDVWYGNSPNDPCLLRGCFVIKAEELVQISQVGVIRDGQLRSNGKSGYLFYGPYRSLEKGSYYLIAQGNFLGTKEAVLDITSDGGNKIYYKGKLCSDGCPSGRFMVPFALQEKTSSLEVRLLVGNEDRIAISGYQITSHLSTKSARGM